MMATRGLVGLAVLAFAGVAMSASTGVNWQKDLDSACKLAAQTNRLVLVHVWGKSCPKCVEMDRMTLSKPEVAKNLEATFVCVKINAEQHPKLVAQYGIQRIPADVVLTPDGKVVNGSVGFYPPAQYLERLNRIAASARNSGRPGSAPGVPGSPGNLESSPDRSLVAAGVQPPYGSAADPRGAGGNPAVSRDPAASRWNNASREPASGAAAPSGANAPGMAGGYSVPPGGNSPERGQGRAGRPEESQAATGGRAIPPTDRLARWPSGNDAASGRRLDGPAASSNGPAASFNGPLASSNGPSSLGKTSEAESHGNPSAERPADSASGRRVNPPLDLDGYCSVTLVEQGRWVRGDRRYGVIHRGRTYLFAGAQEADRFYNNPDRFAPVLSGNDVVLYVEQGQSVPGRRAHGAVYEDRVYLFSGEASYDRFTQDPDRYIRAVTNSGKKLGRGDDSPAGNDLRRDRQAPSDDSGVARDPRDSQESRDSRNSRNFRDGRDPQGGRDSLAPRDSGDSRFTRDDRGQSARAMRDSDGPRDESRPYAGGRY